MFRFTKYRTVIRGGGVGDGRRQKVAVSSCRYRLGKLVGDLSLKEQWGSTSMLAESPGAVDSDYRLLTSSL